MRRIAMNNENDEMTSIPLAFRIVIGTNICIERLLLSVGFVLQRMRRSNGICHAFVFDGCFSVEICCGTINAGC